MGAALIGFFTALPNLVTLVEKIGPELSSLTTNFVAWINHVAGTDPQGYVKQVGQAFADATAAKTVAEREAAAAAIAKAIHGLP